MTELPTGWAETEVGVVAETRLGKMLSQKSKTGAEPRPYLRNKNVQWGRIDVDDVLAMDFDADELERFEVIKGDLLVCEGGDIGRAAVWRGGVDWIGYQKALHRVRPLGGVAPEFLLYCFMWLAQSHALDKHVTGSTIKHLPQEDLRQILIPLPPLNEQRRIVAAIEEHLSRLDAASGSVERAKRRLGSLRRSSLSAAVVNDWPVSPLGEVATTASGGTPSRRRPDLYGGAIPWVKSGELRDGRVHETSETITEEALRVSSAKVFERGTLLIALYGATVGKLGILDMDAATNQAVCAIRPHDSGMTPYLWHVLSSKRPELVAAGQGGAQPNISQAILRRLLVPIPPPDERRRIVTRIEEQLSTIDALTAAIDRTRRRSAALRRALLELAFHGKLVPQEQADEPASVLLERIQAERAAGTKASGPRRVPT